MEPESIPAGFNDMLSFSLIDALLGRRSRRFFMGAEIPDGVFAYSSAHSPANVSPMGNRRVPTARAGTSSKNMLI